jgi:hypothetical protein
MTRREGRSVLASVVRWSGPGVGLGYLGVDVVDAADGPLLEANARPGLAIQIANGRGLIPRLEAIDSMLDQPRVLPFEPVRAVRHPEAARQRA